MPLTEHTSAPPWPGDAAAGKFAATISTESADGCAIALLGLPDDTGVRLNNGRTGAAGGPKAFRAALARYGAADSAVGPLPRVFDAGDVMPTGSLEKTHERVTEATTALLEHGLFPIAIGGGHDLTYPFVRAVAAKYPKLAGIYFDAHLDVRETPGSGMPFRRLVEDCGVSALHLHGFRPLVNSLEHLDWFRAHGGRTHPENAKVALPKAKNLFVSFDLDVLDAAHAPGVSALNPAGWNVREAEAWVRACGADPRVRCFDLMELNPAHDPDGRTARVAAHLFLSFLQGFAQR
ncbi:MAG: formimidoylglutamase [Opitutaceae bacterium]|nr:formimidoylglutamase [Opitutaceae bacterium]